TQDAIYFIFEHYNKQLTEFSSRVDAHRRLTSFPTRRSSDLSTPKVEAQLVAMLLCVRGCASCAMRGREILVLPEGRSDHRGYAIDRKSTRLNSSHRTRSYAVVCVKIKMGGLTAWQALFVHGR